MSISLYKQLEAQKIDELVQEYQENGFKVFKNPSIQELPGFLQSFQVDMIALKEEEQIVIQVKSDESLSASTDLSKLADVINQHEDWQLELVVTNPKHEMVHSELPSVAIIEEKLTKIEQLKSEQQIEAVFLLTWSVFEVAARKCLRNEFPDLALELSPVSTIKQLFAYGLVGTVTYNQLIQMVQTRNSLVHGFFDVSESQLLKQIQMLDEALEPMLSELRNVRKINPTFRKLK